MILESRRRRWWHALFPPQDPSRASTSWVEQRKCKRVLATSVDTHSCDLAGEHYTHACTKPLEGGGVCGFRWAA